jgi:hypothetical protein
MVQATRRSTRERNVILPTEDSTTGLWICKAGSTVRSVVLSILQDYVISYTLSLEGSSCETDCLELFTLSTPPRPSFPSSNSRSTSPQRLASAPAAFAFISRLCQQKCISKSSPTQLNPHPSPSRQTQPHGLRRKDPQTADTAQQKKSLPCRDCRPSNA